MKARIYITLKRGVLDPQGRAVETTLGRLGFDEVEGVRVGKYIELELADAEPEVAAARAKQMCEKLLANTVVEDYRVEIDGQRE